jgi:hypothetical protein
VSKKPEPRLWLTVGTRAGGVVLVIILVGLTSLVALIAYRSAGAVIALTSAACVTLGVALVVAGNPVGRLAPLRWLLDSVELASRFPGVHPIVMFGHVVDCNHLPLWYVPGWLAVQIPTPYMLLLAAGLAGCVKGWRLVGSKSAASWAPFAIQGAVLPVMIVASGAVMYDGLRHLLFMLPPLAMVAASGVTTLGSLAVTR